MNCLNPLFIRSQIQMFTGSAEVARIERSQSLIHQVSDSDTICVMRARIKNWRLNPLFIRSQIQIMENWRVHSPTNTSLNPLFIRSQIQIVLIMNMTVSFLFSLNPLFIRSQIQILLTSLIPDDEIILVSIPYSSGLRFRC